MTRRKTPLDDMPPLRPPPPAPVDVEWVDVDVPLPWEGNPRKISEQAVKAVAVSVERFGQAKPILLRREDRMLIAGHTTLRAVQSLGRRQVLVRWLVISRHDAEALCVADNKTGEYSEWDNDKLGPLLAELRAAEDSAIKATAFSQAEIKSLLMKLEIQRRLANDEDLDTLDPPANPTSVRGKIYELGPHRLMCGDSTTAADVALLLGDRVPLLLFTDPPYGVSYDAEWRARAGVSTLGHVRSGKVSHDDEEALALVRLPDGRIQAIFDDPWGKVWELFLAPVAYVFHASAYADACKVSLQMAGYQVRQQLIWRKPHFALSRSAYHWAHEPCWYAVKEGSTASWIGDRKQSTVWDAESPIRSFGAKKEQQGGGADERTPHSTQKPTALPEKAIANHVPPGELVVDPFCGSGTTIIAADRLKRVCFAMEKDPAYCDVIRDRWRRWTLKVAAAEGGDP